MTGLKKYFPILEWLPTYGKPYAVKDLVAAAIVTIMLVPQSLAYAMLAGLPAHIGLYASILPLVAYAIFGTSRTLAVGPVAVVSLMTAAALGKVAVTGSPEYLAAAVILAMMSGLVLVIMGLLRLGFIANFLSHQVISGFITASGILIATSQLKHILGVKSEGDTLPDMLHSLATNFANINPYTLAIGAISMAFLFWVRKQLKPLLMRFGIKTATADLLAKAGPVLVIVLSILAVIGFDLAAKGVKVHGFYYAPANSHVSPPRGAKPPAIVLAHGGPTSMASRSLAARVQFYTSRGFAVLDVDYAGSTGYGRAYRERLDGHWGVADVADCAAGAKWLAASGFADPQRIAIAGGSAGGYTVLMALATTKAFAAGASHYGISDLSLLLEHTHKFESGYLHRLMGTTPKSWKKIFRERSPLTLIDGITVPVVLFQGLEDRVVPPEQSRLIAEKLRARGLPVELHEFAGEAHGFRRAETIISVLEAELAFLLQAMSIA